MPLDHLVSIDRIFYEKLLYPCPWIKKFVEKHSQPAQRKTENQTDFVTQML